MKIVFTGSMGSGKTTAISSLSDTKVVSTEAGNTDVGRHSKALTTVGMDYGEFELDGGAKVGLYGTPGQERFSFVWPILCRGALGVILLIDHTSEDPLREMQFFLDTYSKFYSGCIVVGITHTDVEVEGRDPDIYQDWLISTGNTLPCFELDMRERDDVMLLVETIITSLEFD